MRPCRMEDGTAWWVCWFEGAACLAVEAAKASETVKRAAYEHFSRRIDL